MEKTPDPAQGRRDVRALKRLPVSVPVRVEGTLGLTNDLTQKGAGVLAAKPWPVGAQVKLEIEPLGLDPVVIHAEVRWARPSGVPRLHLLGCRFMHTAATRRAMAGLLDALWSGRVHTTIVRR
jgi:PilZ domain-containing protein